VETLAVAGYDDGADIAMVACHSLPPRCICIQDN
jgi:hypothetical protein